MSLAELRAATRNPRGTVDYIDDAPDVCGYLDARALPVGVMFFGNRVVRIDISTEGLYTAAGAGIGDTEDRIKALYPGRIIVEPHTYQDGHYLIYRPAAGPDKGYELLFETYENRVTTYRVGTVEAVTLVEGCS